MILDTITKLSGNSIEEIEVILTNLKEWINTDRDLIINILGILSEIPLNDEQKEQLIGTTKNCLCIVEENEVPILVKSLLKTITSSK
jgi:hypothetical protein